MYECRCDERLKAKVEGYKIGVYFEWRNRELKTKPIYECRYNERLKTKTEKSTRLVYTGFHGELEHIKKICLLWIKKRELKIKTSTIVPCHLHQLLCWGNTAVYYESIKGELKRRLCLFIIKSIKRELKTRPIYDCRCDERLEPKMMNLHDSYTLGWSRNWNT